ncbi:hypothetical protein FACS189435_1840 [Bacteroidia bacterium]|nr:hypothetical protein FACS189435_1840 [Bacteroidia bacterium]
MKIVLDTNCLLPAIFKRSMYYWLWEAFRKGDYTLCYTTEILHEYEELLSRLYSPSIVENVINEVLNAPNVVRTTVFFKWCLITSDYDDNKFVDCAISAGAEYVVSNDNHFNVLANISFPKVNVLDILSFKQLLNL